MIPWVMLSKEDMKKLASGVLLDMREGGFNFQLGYTDARRKDSKKKADITAKVKFKKGRRAKRKKPEKNGTESGNGVPKLKRGQKRRKFTLEFKKQIVARMKDGEKPPQLAKELGVGEAILYGWRAGRGMKK